MMKTKHYENVPSLRAWPQHSTAPSSGQQASNKSKATNGSRTSSSEAASGLNSVAFQQPGLQVNGGIFSPGQISNQHAIASMISSGKFCVLCILVGIVFFLSFSFSYSGNPIFCKFDCV